MRLWPVRDPARDPARATGRTAGGSAARVALPRRITFTGDFLRLAAVAPAGRPRPTQHENIFWLAQLLREPLQQATGLPVETVHWDPDWVQGARLECETIRAIYRAFWLEPRIESWARIHAARKLPPQVEGLLEGLFAGSLVVGFELPPWLGGFLRRRRIPFVDCTLSPVRFMDDLLFELSSNHPGIHAACRPHAVPEALIRLQAGMVAAHAARGMAQPPRPGSLLLVLQTSHDRSLIRGGRFARLHEHLPQLEALAAAHAEVLIREHPLQPRPELCALLLERLPRARLTDENTYRLLGHPNLRAVTALSSSVLAEARFFDKRSHRLLPEERGAGATGTEAGPVTLGDMVLAPDFWREVLAPLGLKLSPRDGLRLPPKPNRLRLQLRSAWGYNRIDTDIAVGWARAPER